MAVVGRQGLIASRCDRPHEFDDLFLGRIELEDVAPLRTALKASLRLGITLPLKISLLSKMNEPGRSSSWLDP